MLTYFVWRHPLGIHTGGWGLFINCVVCYVVSQYTEKPSVQRLRETHGIWDKEAVEKIAAAVDKVAVQIK